MLCLSIWADTLHKEFVRSEKVARHNVAPTPLLHQYMHDEAVHAGEGWPSAHLTYEDTTSTPTPQATINIKNLVDNRRAQPKPAPKMKETLTSPEKMTTRQLIGSSKTVTPASNMKSVAKGLSTELWHREEEEEKRKMNAWKKASHDRMMEFEGQKRDIANKMAALEADLADSDED